MRLLNVVPPAPAPRPRWLWRLIGALAMPAMLAACAPDSHYGARVFSVQGKNDWRGCEELTAMRVSYSSQIGTLRKTMDKNAQGAGGGFVNATVHAPTLATLEADRKMVDEALAEKQCPPPKP